MCYNLHHGNDLKEKVDERGNPLQDGIEQRMALSWAARYLQLPN